MRSLPRSDGRWTCEAHSEHVADFVQRTGRSTVTLMLRLLSRSAEDGAIVGHAEIVDTGEVVAVQDVDDLLALVRRLAD